MGESASIRDVARRAGVSTSLVSRVLRGQEGYGSPVTQEAIKRAAAELGYRPNVLAQQLRAGRTTVIGVLFHHLAAFRAFTPTLTGIEEVLRPAGYSLLVASTDGPESEEEGLRLCRAQQTAGVIVLSTLTRFPSAHFSRSGSMPLVAINRWLEEDGDSLTLQSSPIPRVVWDNAGGASMLVEHLVALGHRRLALVSDTPPTAWSHRIGYRQRWEGMRTTAAQSGCPEPALYTVSDVIDGRWRRDGITAFLGITDDVAADVIHALAQQGIVVPRDVSVTGFTNTDAPRITPRLTTSSVPFVESGRAAAQILLQALRGDSVPSLTVVPCSLIERESTAACPLPQPIGGA